MDFVLFLFSILPAMHRNVRFLCYPVGNTDSPNVKGISMLLRDLQSVVLYDEDEKFAGVRRHNSKLPLEINGTKIEIVDHNPSPLTSTEPTLRFIPPPTLRQATISFLGLGISTDMRLIKRYLGLYDFATKEAADKALKELSGLVARFSKES
ncbi:hypothetical protein L2E82_17381 [Cichorium intybus]|uniref:Uncharacterized protein n=2 Tax=Cichorium intybus TaxID=13427 RepID=A0ACB9F838_CICIN|nr:hypothetical protein L2E82_17373 [Cichorium intybus]KAI3767288.1 hypothetical protein L2E82_17381 [Cichorium intybus]